MERKKNIDNHIYKSAMRSRHWNKLRLLQLGMVGKYQLGFVNPAQMDINPDLQEGEMHLMNLPL